MDTILKIDHLSFHFIIIIHHALLPGVNMAPQACNSFKTRHNRLFHKNNRYFPAGTTSFLTFIKTLKFKNSHFSPISTYVS